MVSDPLSITFAALADPTRRAILARLAGGVATVKELSALTGLTDKAVESRLGRLRRRVRELMIKKLRTP